MAARTTLDALTRAYHADLDSFVGRAVESLDEGGGSAAMMLRKLVLEVVRHDVQEEAVLLPLVRQLLPDGDELARAARAEAGDREEVLASLCRRPLGDPGLRDDLRRLAVPLRAHAQQQEDVLRRLAAAADEAVLEAAGAAMTPTQQAGATHSLPPGVDFAAESGWPAPQLPDQVREALRLEQQARLGTGG